MPRPVESHHLQRGVTDGGTRTRVHRCGTLVVTAHADPGGAWAHTVTTHPTEAAAGHDRDVSLRALTQRGYRVLTRQHYTVPAATARAVPTRPALLEGPFEQAWARSWEPALESLARARTADGDAREHVVLLPHFAAYAATQPWGRSLRQHLSTAPQAEHSSGTLAVGVGASTLTWLQTYYMPTMEKTPSYLPGEPGDSDLTYTFAVRLWQPHLPGPLASLAQALCSARDLS